MTSNQDKESHQGSQTLRMPLELALLDHTQVGFRQAARVPNQHLRPRQRGRHQQDSLSYSTTYAHFSEPGIWTSIATVITVIVDSPDCPVENRSD